MTKGSQNTSYANQSTSRFLPSARSRGIAELQSKLATRDRELLDVQTELKVLKQIQRRQDKALSQYESSDNNIPALIGRRDEEIRILTHQLRACKEKLQSSEFELKRCNKKVLELQDKTGQLSALVQGKDLTDRAELLARIQQLEADVRGKEHKVGKLERVLDTEAKTRARMEKSLQAALQASAEVPKLKEIIRSLREQLADKDRGTATVASTPARSAINILPKPQPKMQAVVESHVQTATPSPKKPVPKSTPPAATPPVAVAHNKPAAIPAPAPAATTLINTATASTTPVAKTASKVTSPAPVFVTAVEEEEELVEDIPELPVVPAYQQQQEQEKLLQLQQQQQREEELRQQRERQAEQARIEKERIAALEAARLEREQQERKERQMEDKRRAEEEARRQRDKERQQQEAQEAIEKAREERRKKDELIRKVCWVEVASRHSIHCSVAVDGNGPARCCSGGSGHHQACRCSPCHTQS
jgi:hypothetical protein